MAEQIILLKKSWEWEQMKADSMRAINSQSVNIVQRKATRGTRKQGLCLSFSGT